MKLLLNMMPLNYLTLNILLSDKYCMIPLNEVLRVVKFIKTENRRWLLGVSERGVTEIII
jgi:hypothetical protein